VSNDINQQLKKVKLFNESLEIWIIFNSWVLRGRQKEKESYIIKMEKEETVFKMNELTAADCHKLLTLVA